MSTLTDNDLRELKDLINSKFEVMSKDLTEIKVDLASIKSNQEGFGKRLDNLEFTNRGIFITVISGLLLAVITLTVKVLAPTIG
jgi:murein lipoprotein